jgi:drug/metabolite transporter (DMT)-like permease
MKSVPAAHGGVVLGVLPLATAAAGTLTAGERPSGAFWLSALLGAAAVVAFSLLDGGGRPQTGDLLLLGAVVAASAGYCFGAKAAGSLGGWQTICWALVIALPVTIPLSAWLFAEHAPTITATALGGFLYTALLSQLGGFFVWYRGLALGGVARVSQMQLMQPFLTIGVAAVVLHETISMRTLIFAALVMAFVALGKRAPVLR